MNTYNKEGIVRSFPQEGEDYIIQVVEEQSEDKPLLPRTIETVAPWVDLFLDKIALMAIFIMIYLWRNNVQPKIDQVHDKLGTNLSLDMKIMESLKDIQLVSEASRVIYGEFHNGGHWASGASKLKFSANLEICSPGVSSIKKQIENIPVSSLYDELDLLMKDEKGILFTTLKSPDIKKGCETHLRNIGVEAVYEVLVKSKGEVLGIISIQYTVNNFNRELTDDDVNKIINFKDNISYRVEMFRKEHSKKQGLLKPLMNFMKDSK